MSNLMDNIKKTKTAFFKISFVNLTIAYPANYISWAYSISKLALLCLCIYLSKQIILMSGVI